jgi:hypothetical protein
LKPTEHNWRLASNVRKWLKPDALLHKKGFGQFPGGRAELPAKRFVLNEFFKSVRAKTDISIVRDEHFDNPSAATNIEEELGSQNILGKDEDLIVERIVLFPKVDSIPIGQIVRARASRAKKMKEVIG